MTNATASASTCTATRALCRRAVLHAAMGRPEQARADMARVRTLDPGALERFADVSVLP
ncbi:hypothetical protein ABTX62_34450 [Streptomyces sp. NPDC096046]|uniref:hypothetical protein n=1 Tax=Streptomyces sp. NPDC096046 TaxID=3155542 RepID=UPI00331E7094